LKKMKFFIITKDGVQAIEDISCGASKSICTASLDYFEVSDFSS